MTTPTEAEQTTPTDPATLPGNDGQQAPSPESSSETSSSRFTTLVKAELPLALEVAALTGVTFSRPILDVFGRSPEHFVSRGATTATIVLFGLAVALVPLVVCALVGVASRLFGPTVRRGVHLALVALLAGLAANRLGQDQTGWPFTATKLLLAGAVVAAVVGLARWKLAAVATFLRYLGVASVLFVAQFLVASPASDMAFGGGPSIDEGVAGQVAADLGDDPPPDVVMVVLDALPTASLLDGTGQIDAELYPNLAALADTSTWYRNNTSVAAFTTQAVPALLTGQYPVEGFDSDENLFTLLGGNYDVHGKEQVTQLCPQELCPRGEAAGVGQLLGDAADWWLRTEPDAGIDEFDLPALEDARPYPQASDWVDQLDISPGGRPDFTFLHVELPHQPWRYLDDGTEYVTFGGPHGVVEDGWSNSGIAVGLQRQLLQTQATDRLVGELFDKLRDAGTFDDSLVVLTADHGEAVVPGAAMRTLDPDSIPYIMWTPLFVKAPRQSSAEVDDGNVQAIDVVPTIADVLGIELPWELDGLPAAEASDERDPDFKYFADHPWHELDIAQEGGLLEIEAPEPFEEVLASDYVIGNGPDAVWQRTAHGALLGREIADLDVAESGPDQEMEVPLLDAFDGIDLDEPLPLELFGFADLDVGSVVAYALNGTIAAVAEVEVMTPSDGPYAQALLQPYALVEGANELEAFVVEGQVGDEVLRSLRLSSG